MHLLKADGNQGAYRRHQPRGLGVARRVTRSWGSVPSLRDELQTVLKNLDTGRPEVAIARGCAPERQSEELGERRGKISPLPLCGG